MVKIVWTELSRDDLKEIFDFIAEDSQRYAVITINKIYQRAQGIIDNPRIGRIVPEFGNKNIRELLLGNYRIVYRIVTRQQVDILRIYHSSRLLTDEKVK
jgi:addiction module RelE/StbE family toxin